ncbi:MAG: hypothetical protein HYS07_09055 [Chlamydiae bacterium]|nr:hypothetical protein [Chlamydiota bacterium]MBI3276974.1 hypothetical protein [Chlamydiota bacterium]
MNSIPQSSKNKTLEMIQRLKKKIPHADLMNLVPRKDWIIFSHLLILHGRTTCQARKPLCGECVLEKLCPKIGT